MVHQVADYDRLLPFGADVHAAMVRRVAGRQRQEERVVERVALIDQQSLAGKAVSEVSTRARQAGVPCHAIVGTRDLDSFGLRVLDLQAVFEASTPRQISAAAGQLSDVL